MKPFEKDRIKPPLFNYAYLGENIASLLETLKELAMPEEWSYSNPTSFNKPYPILYNYLLHTFSRIEEEKKILEVDKFSCFNTGLVTPLQEEIFMYFRKDRFDKWIFCSFMKESANELSKFECLPQRAQYYENPSDLIFDHRLDLRVNIEHILNDVENLNRLPSEIKGLSKQLQVNALNGAISHAKKRVIRNYKTAIPQFYRGFTNEAKLQLLLPLCIIDPTKADLALAIFKNETFYMGRTCLTLDMAINNARLIAKPDDEWLKA